MKIGDLLKTLSALDPEMELNDLRSCVTTSADDVENLRELLDDDTATWEEYGAKLLARAVLPMLLEIRDLHLMPAAQKGWLKPAEMAKKVEEQAAAARERCEAEYAAKSKECADRAEAAERDFDERAEAAERDFGERAEAAESGFREKISKMVAEHTARQERYLREHEAALERARSEYRAEVREMNARHDEEVERLKARIAAADLHANEFADGLDRVRGTIPEMQAESVAEALVRAAEKCEGLARMRLARMTPRKGLFRNRDLDSAMLRVEADGLQLGAKRLRRMAEEAKVQGRWPIEFAAGEEDEAPDEAELDRDVIEPDSDREKVAES